MKEERKTIQIEDAVYLTDPCYDITTWCQDLLHNVKRATRVIKNKYNKYEDGTGQEVILSLTHKDKGITIFEDYIEKIDSAVLGVDSGTIGIFDKKYYEEYHYANNINDEWYEKNICDFTHTLRRGANITDGKGVWVNTSYGDGEYYATLYIRDEKICGIEIIC